MHPILFRIGPLTIHTYGLMLAIAFLTGISLAVRQAKLEGEDPQKVFDLCFYLVVAAIIGSRLLFVVLNYRFYLDNPLQIFMLWKGGLVFYGGLLGALMVGTWYIRRHQLPLWKITDILAPSIAAGQAIGRLGCFSAGCCYGRQTDLPWAVTFTDPNCLAPLGVQRHPTQLYSSAAALVIFLLLLLIYRFHRFRGQVFWSYVVLYSVGRFILEYFRGDERGFVRLLGHVLSTSQLISALALIIGITMLIILRKRTPI
jgi:phosphatidylglycerol:prolipoprotein diacylglycerol transferase